MWPFSNNNVQELEKRLKRLEIISEVFSRVEPKCDENGNVLAGNVSITSGSGNGVVKGGDIIIKASQGKGDGNFFIDVAGITYQWPTGVPRRGQVMTVTEVEKNEVMLSWRAEFEPS